MITEAKGNYFITEDKRKILDMTSGGIFAACLGPNNPELRRAASKAKVQCCYNDRPNVYAEALKERLKALTGYTGVALFSTGSEATEAFWRAARVYTGKPYVWGGLINPDDEGKDKPDPPFDSMHGWTLGAQIMAGKIFNPARLGGVKEIGDSMFGKSHEMTGAAIFEPYHAPSAQFHKTSTMNHLRLCIKEYGGKIHYCCDEVQGGMGRTGKLFAHEWYKPKVKPAFVCLGKALGGGYQLSALLGPKEIMEDKEVVEYAKLHSTHSDHPVTAAIGLAVLDIIERDDLIARSAKMGSLLHDLLKVHVPLRVHAGKGLLAGIEFPNAETALKVAVLCWDRGVRVVDTGRQWIKLGPAYTITEEELAAGIKIFGEVVEEVLHVDA